MSDPKELRVTHVVFDFDGGGLESMVAEMARRFHGSATRVSLVSVSGRVGRLGSATRHYFDEFVVTRPRRGISMLYPLGLANVIRATRAEVVHVHTGSWYKAARAARIAGVSRVVYTEHGREHDDPAVKRFIDRRAARYTSAVVAVSQRLADYLAARVGIARKKIHTIHNGVDTSVFSPGPAPAELRASLNIPPGAVVVGSVGRLESVKAYDNLLIAASEARARGARPFVVVIFGEGSERERLEAQARALGIVDIVKLPGWTDRAVDAHRLIDLFVLSSTSEGQSISLMESMACGAAPLVTDVGANAEMLGAAQAACVVPPGEPKALADGLARSLSPSNPLGGIGSLMRQRAVELYSLDRMVAEYDRLYRALPRQAR